MLTLTDEEFASIIAKALDELPEKYVRFMDNVAVVYEDTPNAHQREQLKLHCNETLFGLYQGIPQTARGAGYNLVLPDKITIFKHPILHASRDIAEVEKHVKHTLWHELAHHYGLDHNRIHALEREALEREGRKI
jgi:predicted Zn-dependent protease with MMP-like domain